MEKPVSHVQQEDTKSTWDTQEAQTEDCTSDLYGIVQGSSVRRGPLSQTEGLLTGFCLSLLLYLGELFNWLFISLVTAWLLFLSVYVGNWEIIACTSGRRQAHTHTYIHTVHTHTNPDTFLTPSVSQRSVGHPVEVLEIIAFDWVLVVMGMQPSVIPVESGEEWKSTTFPDTGIVHRNVTFQLVDNQSRETETLCEKNNDKKNDLRFPMAGTSWKHPGAFLQLFNHPECSLFHSFRRISRDLDRVAHYQLI